MIKIKLHKVSIICLIATIILASFSFGFYKYNRTKDYNMLINNGINIWSQKNMIKL